MFLSEYQYIDIHTHSKKWNENVFAVQNLFPKDFGDLQIVENQSYSIGLHPWHISEKTVSEELKIVEKASKRADILAIGEIGLDKAINVPFEKQIEVFEAQLRIAVKAGKTVVIHCVRAYSEILAIRKQIKEPATWIIHGFNANLQTANELLKSGCFLSFGSSLLNPKSKSALIFNTIPTEKIFLETDESLCNIEQIYQTAAVLKKLSLNTLKAQIINNIGVLGIGF